MVHHKFVLFLSSNVKVMQVILFAFAHYLKYNGEHKGYGETRGPLQTY